MAKSVSTDSSKMQRDNQYEISLKDDKIRNLRNSEVLLSTAYLASVEYITVLLYAKKVILEQNETYQKQSYRNRCRIATSNGIMDLNIPVIKNTGDSVKEVRISDHNNWQVQHWRSIETAYNSSPFFEFYSDDLRPFYEKKWVFLWDFNNELQRVICKLLDFENEISFSAGYEAFPSNGTIDLRNSIHPKKKPLIEITPYYQVFEQKFGFISNLSILDLLFNMGNEAQLVLKNTALNLGLI